MTPELQASHLPIYVAPEDLQAGENVRPNETPEQHAHRVEQLAKLIDAEGQLNPIRIKEEEDGRQVILAGQGRRDALLAWCVIDTSTDPLRRAIIDNFGRTNNSPLEVAALMKRVREQHGWKNAPGKKGEGANAKLAAYFGILPSEVTQYEKLGDAPDDIRARLAAGEMTMSGALMLLKVVAPGDGTDEVTARDVRKQVAEKAREIAEEEAPEPKPLKAAAAVKAGKGKDAAAPATAKEPVKVKVTAAHIAKAAAVVTSTVIKAPGRRDILDEITALDGPVSSAAGRKFVQEFLKWADGGTAKTGKLVDAWVALNGTVKPAKASVKAEKPVKAAPKAAKAAKPAKAPATAPRAGKVAKSTTPATAKAVKRQPKSAKAVAKVKSKVKAASASTKA